MESLKKIPVKYLVEKNNIFIIETWHLQLQFMLNQILEMIFIEED